MVQQHCSGKAAISPEAQDTSSDELTITTRHYYQGAPTTIESLQINFDSKVND